MRTNKTSVSFERTLHNSILFAPEQPFAALPRKIRVLDNKPTEYYSLRQIMCPENRFGQLGIPENRLEVAGRNFIVTPNKGKREGLYRALAQALSLDESHYVYIRYKTIRYICKNWAFYRKEIFNGYITIVHELRVRGLSNYRIWKIYEAHAMHNQSAGTLIELHAASKRFQFDFGVMVKSKYIPFSVFNYGEEFHDTNGVKYYFLLTGNCREDWQWEWLVPAVGPLLEIPNGRYYPIAKQAFVFSKHPESRADEVFHPTKLCMNGPVTLSYEDREYYYRVTDGNTLFQILAEMLYGNVGYDQLIKNYITSRKKYLLGPVMSAAKKKVYPIKKHPHERPSKTMNTSMTHVQLAKKSIFEHRGDITDLRTAASIFNFSFTLFGLDRHNNKSVMEYDCHEHSVDKDKLNRQNTVVLHLLLKSDESKHISTWYLLEESSTLKHYKDTEQYSYWNRNSKSNRTSENSIVLRDLPTLSEYQSVPLYDFPRKKPSLFQRIKLKLKSKPKPRPVILLPKILNRTGTDDDADPGILHVDPKFAEILELGTQVPYHMPRQFAFTHPDSGYHMLILDKSRPSTCFPLIAQKIAKMKAGIIPDLTKEPPIIFIQKPPDVFSDEDE